MLSKSAVCSQFVANTSERIRFDPLQHTERVAHVATRAARWVEGVDRPIKTSQPLGIIVQMVIDISLAGWLFG